LPPLNQPVQLLCNPLELLRQVRDLLCHQFIRRDPALEIVHIRFEAAAFVLFRGDDLNPIVVGECELVHHANIADGAGHEDAQDDGAPPGRRGSGAYLEVQERLVQPLQLPRYGATKYYLILDTVNIP
jgi:hypothetical protein